MSQGFWAPHAASGYCASVPRPTLLHSLLLPYAPQPHQSLTNQEGWGRGCCPACWLPDVYICLCPDGEPQHWALVCGYSTQAGSPSSGAHFPRDRQRGTLRSQPSPTSGHCPDPVSQPKSHGVMGQAHGQHPETATHPTLPRLGMSGLSPEMGNIWRSNQQALPEAREFLIQARAAASLPSFQPPPPTEGVQGPGETASSCRHYYPTHLHRP